MNTPESPAAASGFFSPHVIREYALLADGQRGAILGPRGDIVWMCAPHWDSDAVFTSLLAGQGGYSITPTRPVRLGRLLRRRHPDLAQPLGHRQWHHRVPRSARLPGRPPPGRAAATGRRRRRRRRREIAVNPRADFGRHGFTHVKQHDPGTWTGRCGELYVRWSGAPAHTRHLGTADGLVADVTVPASGYHDLVLEISDRPLPDAPPNPQLAWAATEAAWAAAVPSLGNCLEPRDARRSYAVLRGLTGRGGGMVAAATTSLPERAQAGRNYDYRYVWIRDQSYAGQAAAATGADDLLDDAVHFVSGRLLEHGPDLKPAYTTRGGPVPDQRPLDLPGYPGGSNLIGNWVNQQFQLDAFGESLLLLAAAARADRLDVDSRQALDVAATAIGQRWTEPDAGIWEIDQQAWTHSRLICAAGLRRRRRCHTQAVRPRTG